MGLNPFLGERSLAVTGVQREKRGAMDTYVHRGMQLIRGREAEFQLYLEVVRLLSSDILT